MRKTCSALALNMLDASAILWRLHHGGADVGDRWQALADNWLEAKPGGHYAFNDMHAMMACVGAGREAAIRGLLDAQVAARAGEGDNAAFTREVGHPATLATELGGRLAAERSAVRPHSPLSGLFARRAQGLHDA